MKSFFHPRPWPCLEIRVLGCGPSTGVPTVQGYWGACDPVQPHNRRLRTSVSLHTNTHTWLIDAGPDVRHQCLREQITRIDGVLLTHGHFDHMGGLEDLKPFAYAGLGLPPVPIWADRPTLAGLEKRLNYAFFKNPSPATPCPPQNGAGYQPFLIPHVIEGSFSIAGLKVMPFVQNHGPTHSLGFRFSKWAYSTDVLALDDEAFSCLQGVDLWLIDCLGPRRSRGHAPMTEVLSWIARVQPKLAVLIHMGPDMDFQSLTDQLPQGVVPAYDGMRLYIDI
jgi:phosphoribosyl 1,2-cyclic phosphate phosphodiesterase